jgi:hypothetical protein
MKSFLEMWNIIEQGAVATPPNQNPNMQPNKPNPTPKYGLNQPNFNKNQININKNQPNVNKNALEQKSNDPEVQKFVDELTKMLDDGTDLGNFQSQLKKYIGNPKFIEAATKTGPEDKLGVNNQAVDVSLLVPTQAEVFLENSVDAGLENRYGNAPKIIAGSDPAAAGSVVVAQVGGQYHIIDGHHRWSQFMCFNPKSKIQCKIVNGIRSALQGLKFTHLAIAVEKKDVPSEGGNPKSNLLQMSKEQVAEYVKNKIGNNQTKPGADKEGSPLGQPEPILEMFRKNIPEQNLPNAKNASVDEIANYIGDNSQLVKAAGSKASQANPREIMPQTGGTSFDKKLGSGQVNVSPQPQKAQSYTTNLNQNPNQLNKQSYLNKSESQEDAPSLNEWLILAGVKESK